MKKKEIGAIGNEENQRNIDVFTIMANVHIKNTF